MIMVASLLIGDGGSVNEDDHLSHSNILPLETIIELTLHCRAHLRQVGDHVQGDVGVGFMKVPADHAHPGGTVPRVAVRFIESHDMCEVGKFGVLLFQTDLTGEENRSAVEEPEE